LAVGKKIKGASAHVAVNTLGLPIKCHEIPADQRAAFGTSRVKVNVVKRCSCTVKGFVVLPKCWFAERTLGCLNRSPLLARASSQ
jgi:hypothetical protein